MILYTNGDVFNQDTQVIAHQVNCKGVMGAGLAKQVREHISEEDFKEYVTRCQQRGAENLGYNLYTKDTKSNIWIANCFAQDGFGANQKCHTDYSALRACLNHCKTFCYKTGVKPTGLPVGVVRFMAMILSAFQIIIELPCQVKFMYFFTMSVVTIIQYLNRAT